MAKRIITNKAVAPYYDDYDSSKQYTQLLALPGRVAQAREITQLQSVVKDIVKSIGDSILKDGNIIEGCQVIVGTDKTSVTVTAGRVYLHGMVLPVQETTINITGKGTETIGAKLVEYLITEQEDYTLRDPAQGYDNYNQPGCHRIQSQIEIVVNDPEAAILSTLIDGGIAVERYAPEYDTLTQTLARRTYDESGSYIVEGLNVRTEPLPSDSEKSDEEIMEYNVVVEAGKAYVLGYELKIPTARRLVSKRAKTFSLVEYEREYHKSGPQDFALYEYYPFVRDIISVVGIKEATASYNNSTNTDIHALPTGTISIISVKQGDNEYTVGSNSQDGACYLYPEGNSSYIKWNGLQGYDYPTNGEDYQVTYRYRKTYVSEVDYELVAKDGGHYLRWIGDTPEDGTSFIIRFNQYLARKDVVYMDRYGNISLAVGTPAEVNHDVTPEVPLNTLTLAIIDNPPNGSAIVQEETAPIEVNNIGLTRFTMNDIQALLNRLKTLEFDQATLSLNDEARNDDMQGKKGIYTDPLIDFTRIDMNFNKLNGVAIDPNKSTYDMAIDFNTNIAYLPIITRTSEVEYSSASSTTKKHNRLLTLGTTGAENYVLTQMNATKSFLINPYSVFPQLPEVSVTPAVDSWIDDTIIEVPVSRQTSTVVRTSSRTVDNTGNWTGWMATQYATRSSSSTSTTAIGTRTTVSTSESIVSESAATYIRKRTLTVEGYDFPTNLDNIRGYFDGVLVPLTPVDGTEAGSVTGSVKSNGTGYLKATFEIPDNIRTGTREILLKSDIVRDGYVSEGFTLYVAQGLSRTIRRTVTTLTTVLLQRTTTTVLSSMYIDPVGQTFVLDRMTILKGIDLYFESKPDINVPVVCEIREVDNGTITSQVYAHKSLPASSVVTSSDSRAATRFEFDDPVLLEENKEYAFVVRSTSDAYTIWVAELGGIEITTVGTSNPQQVLKNPYMTGVMLSSSNNSTWTAHQTMDVKFRLVEDVYALSSTAQFNDIRPTDFSRILLLADSAIPPNTSLSWSYSSDGNTYTAISPYELVTLRDMRDRVSLKATLSRDSSTNLSPMIALDTIAVTTSCYDLKGFYSMKNVEVADERDPDIDKFTELKVILDTYEPTGTSISVKYSIDNGETIQPITTKSTTRTFDYNWRENVYTATVEKGRQFRIFVEAATSSRAVTPAFRKVRVIVS